MDRILFLLSPVLMSGFCLLAGEIIHWAKERRHHKGLRKMNVVFITGRV